MRDTAPRGPRRRVVVDVVPRRARPRTLCERIADRDGVGGDVCALLALQKRGCSGAPDGNGERAGFTEPAAPALCGLGEDLVFVEARGALPTAPEREGGVLGENDFAWDTLWNCGALGFFSAVIRRCCAGVVVAQIFALHALVTDFVPVTRCRHHDSVFLK
jgi:hypothetical protein